MKVLSVVICLAILFVLSMKPSEAARSLHDHEDEDWMAMQHLVLQSLPQGGGGNPSPNHCGNVPSPGSSGPCASSTISEKNFAGHAVMAPPLPPPAHPYFEKTHQFQSLQHGDSGTPSRNKCGNVPSPGSSGPCASSTISEKNFAGHAVMVPPPPPSHRYFEKTHQFRVATNRK